MTILAFLILIGILIWVHEFGHFLMAKLFRVRVEVFSIGFGPAIVRKQWGETLYQIAVIPLGGYVKLFGEEERISDPRAFSSRKPWQKILIALGGPLFNFIFTLLVFTLIYTIGIETPKYFKENVVIGYVEKNSLAEKIGLRPGDKIIRIDGYKIKQWDDLREALLNLSLKGIKETEIYIEREGKLLTFKLPIPDVNTKKESLGIAPKIPPIVGKVIEGSPASQIGLREGDKIVEVNDKKISTWYELVKRVQESRERPIKLKIKRGNNIIEKEVIPAINPGTGKPFLGVMPKIETVKEKHSLGEALNLAVQRTYELTVLTFKTLWGLITGTVSFKTLGGPIAIAQFAGQAAESGLIPYLSMMAFISLQLGIFNLLPLPILDGGLILLFLIEWFRGRPLPEKFKENWQRIGFALIVTLMMFVLINDILRLLGVN
ncbi:MAG TPA: RIP metalloprotease RseP [Aquifex aeolicus]|nr:RIP metalloprotease RseP [Aquifex aeolicus]